jgi:hypothetical protein
MLRGPTGRGSGGPMKCLMFAHAALLKEGKLPKGTAFPMWRLFDGLQRAALGFPVASYRLITRGTHDAQAFAQFHAAHLKEQHAHKFEKMPQLLERIDFSDRNDRCNFKVTISLQKVRALKSQWNNMPATSRKPYEEQAAFVDNAKPMFPLAGSPPTMSKLKPVPQKTHRQVKAKQQERKGQRANIRANRRT